MTWLPNDLVSGAAADALLSTYGLLPGQVPPRRTVGPALLLVVDCIPDCPGAGPQGFDTPPFHRWLRCASKSGLVALICVGQQPDAIAALSAAALAINGGAVVVSCKPDDYAAWEAFLAFHAEGAARYVSGPPALLAAAKTRREAEALHAAKWVRRR